MLKPLPNRGAGKGKDTGKGKSFSADGLRNMNNFEMAQDFA